MKGNLCDQPSQAVVPPAASQQEPSQPAECLPWRHCRCLHVSQIYKWRVEVKETAFYQEEENGRQYTGKTRLSALCNAGLWFHCRTTAAIIIPPLKDFPLFNRQTMLKESSADFFPLWNEQVSPPSQGFEQQSAEGTEMIMFWHRARTEMSGTLLQMFFFFFQE